MAPRDRTMNRLFAITFGLALVSGGADARPHAYGGSPSHHRSYVGEWDLINHESYTNVSGRRVHSPSRTFSGRVPAGASATCGDGSYSFSEHHRGTCSHHGGVSRWMR